jgi:hypothetical protein
MLLRGGSLCGIFFDAVFFAHAASETPESRLPADVLPRCFFFRALLGPSARSRLPLGGKPAGLGISILHECYKDLHPRPRFPSFSCPVCFLGSQKNPETFPAATPLRGKPAGLGGRAGLGERARPGRDLAAPADVSFGQSTVRSQAVISKHRLNLNAFVEHRLIVGH